VKFTIENLGPGDAGPFDVRVVFDPDQALSTNVPIPDGLAAGKSLELDAVSPEGGNCFDPNCTVCITVDNGSVVGESSEDNNLACATRQG